MTICYHTTSAANAAAILIGGFKDTTGVYPPYGEMKGVFLGDQPLSDGEGLPIGTPAERYKRVLRVEFPDDFDLDPYLHDSQPGPPIEGVSRSWHMPASVIKEHATVTPLADDDTDDGPEQQ